MHDAATVGKLERASDFTADAGDFADAQRPTPESRAQRLAVYEWHSSSGARAFTTTRRPRAVSVATYVTDMPLPASSRSME